jgi:protein-S-isoprenylcysteine O-methyltransferase Ste14
MPIQKQWLPQSPDYNQGARKNVFLLLRILVFTLIVPATVVIYVPAQLARSPGPPAVAVAGGLVMGAGLLLVVWCFFDFAARGRGTPAPWDPPQHLVTNGPYRHVRNPIYVGVLSILLGEAVFFGSVALLAWAGVTALGFHLVVVLYEEPGLRDRFGSEYERYLADVPRWLPRLGQG